MIQFVGRETRFTAGRSRRAALKGGATQETLMCLAVPGKILEVEERDGSRIARVQFGGITRPAYLDFVPEAVVGDYVMVHVGFAISRVNAEEAARTYELLEEMGQFEESDGTVTSDG